MTLRQGPNRSYMDSLLPPALAFSTTDAPPEDMLLAVDTGLEQHNHAVAPLDDVRQLAAFARDETGTVVGGAVGRTWGECCELLQLWEVSGFLCAEAG